VDAVEVEEQGKMGLVLVLDDGMPNVFGDHGISCIVG
jgi:hypothetical protein